VRGGATPLIVPNPFRCTRFPCPSYGRLVIVRSVRLLKFTVLFTVVNWTVLNALKISSRISNFAPCAMPRFFAIDRSRLLSGGSRAKSRGVSSPLLPGCGGAKHSSVALDYRIAVGPGQVPGADARNQEVDDVRSAARPSVDARDLPFVD
jgi:hypothetical protein